MSHMLEEKEGQEASMFSVGQTPWHKLGMIIEQAPTIEEGIKLAQMDWEVGLKDLFTADKQLVTHKAVYRKDNNEVLNIVGPNWKPLQNIESFKFFDKFLEEGAATLETAGVLDQGQRTWVLAKITDGLQDIVKGDPLQKYILLSNIHGIGSVRVGFTPIRVVCNNTLTAAIDCESSKLIRIKHSSQVVENVELIKDVMQVANRSFEANIEQYVALTKKEFNSKDIENFVQMVFFPNGLKDATKSKNRFDLLHGKINELIETGLGSDIKGVKGSYWGLYNAGAEYLTHYAKKDDHELLKNQWFGNGVKQNQLMLDTCLELAEIA